MSIHDATRRLASDHSFPLSFCYFIGGSTTCGRLFKCTQSTPCLYYWTGQALVSVDGVSYFPNGERMISGTGDLTARQLNMQVGKEVPKLRDVCKRQVRAVAVSRDGRWHFNRRPADTLGILAVFMNNSPSSTGC